MTHKKLLNLHPDELIEGVTYFVKFTEPKQVELGQYGTFDKFKTIRDKGANRLVAIFKTKLGIKRTIKWYRIVSIEMVELECEGK